MQDEPTASGSTPDDGQPGDGHVDAAPLIDAFGGIRPMASKLGVPVSTVQGWRERNAIPVARLDAVRAAAAKHDIALTPEHVVLQIGAPPDADEPAAAPREVPKSSSPPPPPGSTGRRRRDGGFPPIAGLAGVAFVVALVAMFLSVVATRQAREGAVVVAEDGAPLALAQQLSDRMAALEDSGDSTATRVAVLEALTEENAALAAQVTALTEGLAATEATLAESGDGGAELPAEFADRLAALESAAAGRATGDGAAVLAADVERLRLQDAATATAIADLAAGVDGLAGQVAALEERPRQAGLPAAAGVDPAVLAQGLAVMRLRQGLADGKPLDPALAMAAQAFAGDAALLPLVDDIAAAVAAGVPSRAVLGDDLGRITEAPAAADAVNGAGAGWLARAQARVANVVTVERTDGSDAMAASADAGTAAALTEARQRLAEGDLAAAVETVAVIAAEGGEGAGWLAAARHRLALEAAVDALEAAVFDRMTAG